MKEIYNQTLEEISKAELDAKVAKVKSFIKDNLATKEKKEAKIKKIQDKIVKISESLEKVQTIESLDEAVTYIDSLSTKSSNSTDGLYYSLANSFCGNQDED